jgi:hypothetical protein
MEGLDLWIQKQSPSQTYESLATKHEAYTNASANAILIYKWNAVNDLLDFFYFITFIEDIAR